MTKFKLIIVLFILFITPQFCFAESKEIKLYELARYEGITEQFVAYKKVCIEKANDFNPDYLIKENPYHYGGINPSSKYWGEVKSIYREFVSTNCSYLDEEKVLNAFIEIYSEELSEEALDGILAFYQTSAGGKYLDEISICSKRMQVYYLEASHKKYKQAMKKLSKSMAEVVSKYNKEK